MAISDFHASTIVKVQASFVFSEFACDPDVITCVLGVLPDEIGRKGMLKVVRGGSKIYWPFNTWLIQSHIDSKDINEHLRELLGRLTGAADKIRKDFGEPTFSIFWEGNYLYAGSGPFYEADVISGIAGLKATLYQDIYQVDQEEPEPVVS